MSNPQDTTQDRLVEMLANAMGATIGDMLHDPAIEELRSNPDGRLWCVREGARHNTGKVLTETARRQLISIVAHAVGVTVDETNPSFPAELPESGYRFHAVIPPQSPDGPTFVIRKKPMRVFTLDEYVEAGIMTAEHVALIREAVANRENILVGGGTGSGKTTLTNAILKEIGRVAGRVLTVEDTLELQVEADEVVRQRTVRNGDTTRRSMQDIVRDMLRLSPDRIVVGEVRGPEAIDLIQGWNTGHPGGVATIHCNSAVDAMERLEDLLNQGGYTPVPRQLAKAVNVILFIGNETVETPLGLRAQRRLRELLRTTGVRVTESGYAYTFDRHFQAAPHPLRCPLEQTELLHVSNFPSALHDEVADKIAAFSVGFAGIEIQNGNEIATQSGSGTLVELDGKYCIFTADHVIESLARKSRISLLVDWSGGFRRCAFDVSHLQFVRLPRGPTDESGPDLGAIVLPTSGEGIATLRSLKVFYNLGKRVARFDGVYPDVREGFWFPVGVLGEGSSKLEPTRGFAAVSGHWGLCAVAACPNESMNDGFDYLELRVHYDVGQDIPSTFGGLSGGGLWQAKLRKSAQGELCVEELIYSGVIFYESAVVDEMRRLKCHGRASVHERIVEELRK